MTLSKLVRGRVLTAKGTLAMFRNEFDRAAECFTIGDQRKVVESAIDRIEQVLVAMLQAESKAIVESAQ